MEKFKRHPSVFQYDGDVPRCSTYLLAYEESRSETRIEPGEHFNQNVSAYWANEDSKTYFRQSGRDWQFKLSKLPGDYFSISWALNPSEIEILKLDMQVSLSFRNLVDGEGNVLVPELSGRMNIVKGKRHDRQAAHIDRFNDRTTFGFSLNNPNIAYNQAFKIWFDIIFVSPEFKAFTIEDPLLAFQSLIAI